MSLHMGPKPAEEGAYVAHYMYLATLPAKSNLKRGTFWANKKEVPWKQGCGSGSGRPGKPLPHSWVG